MTSRRHFGERWLHAAFRWHPVRFRQAYADEMLDYYRETCAREVPQRGRIWQLRFLMRSIAAAAHEGIRQRRLASPPKERAMTGLTTDVRHAVRRMRARPLASGLAAGMLALAIGVATAMFTLVDALLLTPAPFPDAASLGKVTLRTDHTVFGAVSPAILRAWRDSGVFAAVEGAHTVSSVIETGDLTFGREAAFVTPGALRQLGARPIAGRVFGDDEGRTAVEDAVIVSERLWRNVLASSPSIVGTRIRVDNRQLMVVGVLPDTFRFPKWDTELWRPIDYNALPSALAASRPIALVRFGTAVPEAAALERATALTMAIDPKFGRGDSNLRAARYPLSGVNSQGYLSQATPFLAGSVCLVFLVLCANVCSLLLAQLGARAREFGMCTALGASRRRLLRQAFTESGLLGTAALLLGIAVAWLLISMARTWLPDSFLMQTLNPIDLDPRTLLAASALGLAAMLAAGLLPAWIGTRVGGSGSSLLRAESRGATESRLARRVTRGLLVGEIALSCTLLLGTALLVMSFVHLARVDRGLDAHGVITAWLQTRPVPEGTPADAGPAGAIDEAARHMPGVTRVMVSGSVPPSGAAIHFGAMWLPDTTASAPLDLGAVSDYRVTPDFFDMFHIRLLRGRTFEPGDDAHHVVVSEQFASRLWPGAGLDVAGRSFTFQKESYGVIGVVNEIRYPSLEAGLDGPEVYRQEMVAGGQLYVSLKCAQACPSLPIVRQTLLALPDVRRVYTLANLEDTYLGELARPKAAAALATVFGGIGLIAAAGGLFSVLSYAVARRRREFGIRMSLGAAPGQLHRLVFREGAQLAIAGAAIGGATAWGLASYLRSVVYDVTVADPAVWLSVFALVSITTIAAVWVPSRRAARVDPVELLRES